MKQPTEEVGLILKRNAAITGRVIVSALEALAWVAKEKRARCHEVPSAGRAILEGPRDDDGNRHLPVLLLEGAIARSGRTYDVRNRPSVARRKRSTARASRRTADAPFDEGTIELACNFPQDAESGGA